MAQPYITLEARTIKGFVKFGWPPKDKTEFCSMNCLTSAIREDMGVR